MKTLVIAAVATVLLSSCGWTTNRNLLPDDPDDRAVHTGSHIPVKENTTAGKATNSGDADAMIRNQRAGAAAAANGAEFRHAAYLRAALALTGPSIPSWSTRKA